MYWIKPSTGHQDHLVLEHMYEESLRDLGFLSLKKRGLRGVLTAVFSCLMEGNRDDEFSQRCIVTGQDGTDVQGNNSNKVNHRLIRS